MTREQENKILTDKQWIKISYRSISCSGEMILKKSMYELRKKKIEKLLKGLEIEVYLGYIPTFEEYLELHSEYVNQFRLVCALKLQRDRYVRSIEDMEEFDTRIEISERNLTYIIDRLNDDYKEEFKL